MPRASIRFEEWVRWTTEVLSEEAGMALIWALVLFSAREGCFLDAVLNAPRV